MSVFLSKSDTWKIVQTPAGVKGKKESGGIMAQCASGSLLRPTPGNTCRKADPHLAMATVLFSLFTTSTCVANVRHIHLTAGKCILSWTNPASLKFCNSPSMGVEDLGGKLPPENSLHVRLHLSPDFNHRLGLTKRPQKHLLETLTAGVAVTLCEMEKTCR